MTKLREMRMRAGISQSELAERSGISKYNIQHYEQGKRNFDNTSIDRILKVCLILDCKIEEIIENDDYLKLWEDYKKII